jgi:hypothetical protein
MKLPVVSNWLMIKSPPAEPSSVPPMMVEALPATGGDGIDAGECDSVGSVRVETQAIGNRIGGGRAADRHRRIVARGPSITGVAGVSRDGGGSNAVRRAHGPVRAAIDRRPTADDPVGIGGGGGDRVRNGESHGGGGRPGIAQERSPWIHGQTIECLRHRGRGIGIFDRPAVQIQRTIGGDRTRGAGIANIERASGIHRGGAGVGVGARQGQRAGAIHCEARGVRVLNDPADGQRIGKHRDNSRARERHAAGSQIQGIAADKREAGIPLFGIVLCDANPTRTRVQGAAVDDQGVGRGSQGIVISNTQRAGVERDIPA